MMYRLFFAVVLILTTHLWPKALHNYEGLLSTANIVSLVALVALALLLVLAFMSRDHQTLMKALTICLTLASVAGFAWFISGLTVVLLFMVGLSVLSLGVLFGDDPFGAFAVWWQTFTVNRRLRQERKQHRVPDWDSPELNRVPQEDHLTPVS